MRYFTTRRPVIIPVSQERLTQKIEWITGKLFAEIISQYSKYKLYNIRLLDLQQALLSSFDFDASQIFSLISSNGEVITGEDFIAFITGFDREISTEEIGCLLRVTDRQG